MKFFIRFFIGLAILLAIIVGIYWLGESGGDFKSWLGGAMEAQPIKEQKPPRSASDTDFANNAFEKNQNIDYEQLVRAAAQANGVTVVRLIRNGFSIDVSLSWQGAIATKGGDVLDDLLRSGHLSDFDQSAPPVVRTDRNGRTVYTAQYLLYMK